jgi:hypothetical protein
MFGAEGQDVTSWTSVMEWVYLLAMAQEGAFVGCDFRSGETSVWMFCGLGNAVKNYVVISWPCTKGSVHCTKWRLIVA